MNRFPRLRFNVVLAFIAALMLAACTNIQTGGAELSVTGLPDGTIVDVTVTGPNGFAAAEQAPTTLTGLPPGSYTLEADVVELPNGGYIGFERFAADAVAFEVAATETASATLAFEYVGARIEDEIGDAAAVLGNPLTYDIVGLATSFDEDNLMVVLELEESQTDLSELITLFDLDIDQDPTTAHDLSNVDAFCVPTPGSLGIEYGIDYEAGVGAVLYDAADNVIVPLTDPVIAGSTATFHVPLTEIEGATRINLGLILGNFDAPTDCTQGTATI
ncbi:MAG TPA: carboxypeptidase-like regulatory domain-containing protein [Trueperaceae bacterium]|nr:carboxypeptidase-like regulatory domain-containing protein [Trueperaceae bacterium]